MTLALMLATVKIAEGEVSTVYTPLQPLQLNDHFFSQENAPAFSQPKGYTATSAEKERITRYIREVFQGDGAAAIKIAQCESGLNAYAYNPETIAKQKGVTLHSSCGVFQINSSECELSENPLYSYRENIDRAFALFQKRNWSPWLNCKNKLGL